MDMRTPVSVTLSAESMLRTATEFDMVTYALAPFGAIATPQGEQQSSIDLPNVTLEAESILRIVSVFEKRSVPRAKCPFGATASVPWPFPPVFAIRVPVLLKTP